MLNIRFILVPLGQHLDAGAVLHVIHCRKLSLAPVDRCGVVDRPQAFRPPGLRCRLLGTCTCAAHAQSDCQQNVWLLVEPLGSVGTTVLIEARFFKNFESGIGLAFSCWIWMRSGWDNASGFLHLGECPVKLKRGLFCKDRWLGTRPS